MLALTAAGQFLGMTLWFSATAVAPAIAREISSGGSLALTMAVQGGFVVGTLLSAVLGVADLIGPRRLFALGCLAGALTNGAIALSSSEIIIIALRAATGIALAFVYPPGLKIAAGWFRERRGTALGVLVGALTIGSAFPHLLAWAAADVSWRTLVGISSALALAGGALVLTFVEDGPYVTASSPFDPHAIGTVVGNRGVRLATLGYLGHMWELYAMWAWIATFATASLAASTLAPRAAGGSLVAFIAIASGAAGCVIAGMVADRWGKARVAGWSMVVSGSCSLAAGVAFGAPMAALAIFAALWGFAIVADSAQFSALVSEYSPRTHVGTALTLQVCLGFLLTMVSMRVVPAAAARVGWAWAFACLAPGPFIGALAMWRLSRDHKGGA
jgi:MFS family permease